MKKYLTALFISFLSVAYCDFDATDKTRLMNLEGATDIIKTRVNTITDYQNEIRSNTGHIEDDVNSINGSVGAATNFLRYGLFKDGGSAPYLSYLSHIYDMLHHSADSDYGDMSWLQLIKEENSLWRQEHEQPYYDFMRFGLGPLTNLYHHTYDNIFHLHFGLSGTGSKVKPSYAITYNSVVKYDEDWFHTTYRQLGYIMHGILENSSGLFYNYCVATNQYNYLQSKLNSWDTFYNIYTNQYLQSFLTRPGLTYSDTTTYSPYYLWLPSGARTIVPQYNERKTLQGFLATVMDYVPTVLASINVGLAKIYDDFSLKLNENNNLLGTIAELVDDIAAKDFSVTNSLSLAVTNNLNLVVTNDLAGVDLSFTNWLYSTQNQLTNDIATLACVFGLDYSSPLTEWDGETSLHVFFTNKYVDVVTSSSASNTYTNWFNRVEMLLGALVFSDGDGTNVVSNSESAQNMANNVSNGYQQLFSVPNIQNNIDDFRTGSTTLFQSIQDFSACFEGIGMPSNEIVYYDINTSSSAKRGPSNGSASGSDKNLKIRSGLDEKILLYCDIAHFVTSFFYAIFGLYLVIRYIVWLIRMISLFLQFAVDVISALFGH